MRRSRILYVISAFSAVILAAAAPQPAAASATAAVAAPALAKGPSLVPEQPTGDVGEVMKGATAEHVFEIRNAGDQELVITEVLPSCGCTITEVDANIPPGGTGKIKAIVNTLNLNGTGNTKLKVTSNDPQSPHVLTVLYNVVSKLSMKPGFGRWLTTLGEKEGTIGNTLWSLDGKQFNVTKVETPMPQMQATFRPATGTEVNDKASGSQWRIELTLKDGAPVGAITGEVLVHTDHPDQKIVPLPVSGFVRPTVFVFPAKGEMGAVKAETLPVRATFKVTNFATEPMQITDVKVSIPGATTAIEQVKEGREYKVAIVLPAEMPQGPFSGTLRVSTDSAKMPLVEVPVSGTIEASAVAQAPAKP